MTSAAIRLKFPGYGVWPFFKEARQPAGYVLALFAAEIPQAGKIRFLTFRGTQGGYTLMDDFVYDERAGIGAVSSTGNKLVYSTALGTKVIERVPSAGLSRFVGFLAISTGQIERG